MEKFKHQGASSTGLKMYSITVRCIYSGNSRTYTTTLGITDELKERYTSKYMKEECDCPRCIEKRTERTKMVESLKRDGCYRELKLLGEVI